MKFELVQIISLCGNLLFLLLILYTVYRGRLREAYAILWIVVAAVMILESVSPALLELCARLLGIKTPAFALLSCLTMGIMLLCFQMTVVISMHSGKISRLTQEVTLLREELDRLRDKEP